MSLSFCGSSHFSPSWKGQLNPPSYPHCPEEDSNLGMVCPNLSISASGSPSTGTRNSGPKSSSLKGLPLSLQMSSSLSVKPSGPQWEWLSVTSRTVFASVADVTALTGLVVKPVST